MGVNEGQFWGGIAMVVVAGVLLFATVTLGLPYVGVVGAISVFGLAAGAWMVGCSGGGRPV